MTDRESHGLRGEVRLCTEETTYPGAIGADGHSSPEVKQVQETEFDAEGRLTVTRGRNGDGSEWMRQNFYDVSGRLERITVKNISGLSTHQVYTYGDDGRLLRITNSAKPNNAAVCQYDEKGRKTMLQISRPEDYENGGAVCGSPFSIAAEAPNFPGGGSSLVSFDDQDRPYQAEVRGPKGELVNRVVCIYDDKGRVIEERATVENVTPTLPMEIQKLMVWPHIRQKVNDFFGNRKTSSSVLYTYDEQGRLVTRRNDGQLMEFAYNEHGDKVTEITRLSTGVLPPGFPSYSEAHYDYEYDRFGNWIEERTSYRSTPDGALQHSGTRRRELTYF
jgi:YD repeat-containing protein